MFFIQYKISIIIPIFNQEKYLKNAIESVINQTINFEEIELILIDDKSSDKSKEIIETYSSQYKNIVPIFFDENSGGASKPKNAGIKKATAPFLMFLDPDDELIDDTCEILYNEIIKEQADIVSGNAIRIINNVPYIDLDFSNDLRKAIVPDKNYNNRKIFRICGSLCSRELILKNNIYFLDVKTNEDTYFREKTCLYAKKISYLDDHYSFIYHVRNNNSLSQTFTKEALESTIEAFYEIKKLIVENYNNISEDPCLKNIYGRFGRKWKDTSKKEEYEIYDKMLEYRNSFTFNNKLILPHKIIDILLSKKLYFLLYFYHKILVKLISNKFIKSFILKAYDSPKIEENNPIYKKIENKLYS